MAERLKYIMRGARDCFANERNASQVVATSTQRKLPFVKTVLLTVVVALAQEPGCQLPSPVCVDPIPLSTIALTGIPFMVVPRQLVNLEWPVPKPGGLQGGAETPRETTTQEHMGKEEQERREV